MVHIAEPKEKILCTLVQVRKRERWEIEKGREKEREEERGEGAVNIKDK